MLDYRRESVTQIVAGVLQRNLLGNNRARGRIARVEIWGRRRTFNFWGEGLRWVV